MASSDEEHDMDNEAEEEQSEQVEAEEPEEEEEEYYDEDEDEEEEQRPKKKKKKKSIREQFLIDEAAEDDDQDEEDEEDEPEDGYYQIVKEQEKADRESSRELHSHRDLYNKMEREDDVRELADYLKHKYSKANESSYGTSDQLSDTITQQRFLPGVKDPNLWTVKCKMGEEKQTALLLMRKYNVYLNKADKQPLSIKSVIVKEGLRGFIYIEAYKNTHVKAAIEEVCFILFIWTFFSWSS